MTVPGGTRTPQEHCNFLRARHTGFSHRVGVSSVYLAPTLRFALRRERGSVGSALPLPPPCWYQSTLSLRRNRPFGVERNRPFRVCARCLPASTIRLIVKPGALCDSPSKSGPAFLLTARRWSWAVWSGAVLHFACTGFSDIVASALRLCYLVCKRSVGEGEQKPCDE